jgi:molybdenum cofactor synthesis domain-containing protein
MISISKASAIVKRETVSLGTENVRIAAAVGRVLAEDIRADSDMPPFDRSQMDGFAVRASDAKRIPAVLKIVGESAAGRGWHRTLRSGEAVRIMTGAPVPDGADSVQKIELTSESDAKGAEIRKGERLFRSGERISEMMIATLAAFGYSIVKVAEKPLVSILSTGTEIVAIGKQPGRDQIRNSNSVMLKVLAEQAGARVKLLTKTGDDLAKLKSRISAGVDSGSDIVAITGGVSVGKYDLTKAAELFFETVRLRPGKPTVFARLGNTLIFGLPGNPVSAAVTFYLFARLAIMKMQNASQVDLRSGFAVLTSDAKAAKERDTYLPAKLSTSREGVLLADPIKWHGSSDFVGFAAANALLFLGKGQTLASGSTAKILFL